MANEELEELIEQYRELDSLDYLVDVLVSEVRNPLTSALMATELLESDSENDAELVGIIKTSLERIQKQLHAALEAKASYLDQEASESPD